MFPMYDCEKCGGFYPGSPNAYMGTFCRCPREVEEESETEEEAEETDTYNLFFNGDLAYEGVDLEFCEEAHKRFEGNVCVVTWERVDKG